MQYTEIDNINAKRFNDGCRSGYKCKMCSRLISLNNSISYKGVNLVCMRCYNRFKDIFNDNHMLATIQETGKDLERYNKLKFMEV